MIENFVSVFVLTFVVLLLGRTPTKQEAAEAIARMRLLDVTGVFDRVIEFKTFRRWYFDFQVIDKAYGHKVAWDSQQGPTGSAVGCVAIDELFRIYPVYQ